MNLEFQEEINNIINNINEINKSYTNKLENNNNNNISSSKKKIISGNIYELEQHKRKQKYLTYTRCIKSNPDNIFKTENYNLLDSNKSLLDTIEKYDYKKNWSRLDLYQKNLKFQEFVDSLIYNNKLKEDLRQKLIDDLKQFNIKKDKSFKVEYNKDTCSIISIKPLTINPDKNYNF